MEMKRENKSNRKCMPKYCLKAFRGICMDGVKYEALLGSNLENKLCYGV